MHRQELIVIAVVLIVVGAVIWLAPWPIIAQPATNVVGQVLFWFGIALLILWIILIGIYLAKTQT